MKMNHTEAKLTALSDKAIAESDMCEGVGCRSRHNKYGS